MSEESKLSASSEERAEPWSSNAVRLRGSEWIIAVVLLALAFAAIPVAWRAIERFDPGEAYRTPYALSDDYWQYDRYCRYATEQDRVLVLGDSVIWGEYVTPDQTLPEQLNALAGGPRFMNLGINGIHPVALAGLIAYYGRAIEGRDVILHYNPLWMSSMQHDLQTEKEFRFNHPRLVPQFLTQIPCYKDPYAERIGIAVERYFPFRGWVNHVTVAYFDNTDPATWTRENPYANPFSRVTLELPQPSIEPRHEDKPWYDSGITPVPFEWVPADESLQWRFFQAAVDTLTARGNRVFVLVGPFNEHLIAEESRPAYADIKEAIAAWLDEAGLPHAIADVLPSELYGDASHPLAAGYAELAERLWNTPAFREFL
ncbi:MAG TPA: hypothetical protein PLO37_26280 [Candidatus Hydrogenedentes bacterium]|nr:hypothetical protein [Candidatus Hydrogenedentota bacterium]HPG70363.1 hypothetical protein [Candidatus Hydrogenedentota bacterium]